MCREPEDELLAALFRARFEDAGEEPDLNRIVELAKGRFSLEEAEEWREILSLPPEARADLMALREDLQQEAGGGGEAGETKDELLKAVAGARWRGTLRIGYTKEGLFRVADPGGAVRFPRWIDKVFAIGKRMTRADEVGIWPAEGIDFGWPGKDPILRGSMSVREEAPILTVRRSHSGEAKDRAQEVEVEYWRGGQWVGAATLWKEEPQLVIHLRPEWPYILAVRGHESLVLKIATHRVEFSPAELRAAALLRVLAGDVDGGFDLIRSRLVQATQVFRWTLGFLSRCLPEESATVGYAVVRDAATREEVRSWLRELFGALAVGWMEATGGALKEGEIERKLEERKGPVARGFLLALRGAYKEAVAFWESPDEETPSQPYVAAALCLACRLNVPPKSAGGNLQPFADERLEKVLRCFRELAKEEGQGEEYIGRLAEGLGEVCREVADGSE